MKKRDLIKLFEKNGWQIEEGSNHTLAIKGENKEAIPRHKEINELLAKAIIKRNNLR
jgi:YcfA-like protein.